MRGQTMQVTLDCTFEGRGQDPLAVDPHLSALHLAARVQH